jgi:hypothetical protein
MAARPRFQTSAVSWRSKLLNSSLFPHAKVSISFASAVSCAFNVATVAWSALLLSFRARLNAAIHSIEDLWVDRGLLRNCHDLLKSVFSYFRITSSLDLRPAAPFHSPMFQRPAASRTPGPAASKSKQFNDVEYLRTSFNQLV